MVFMSCQDFIKEVKQMLVGIAKIMTLVNTHTEMTEKAARKLRTIFEKLMVILLVRLPTSRAP
jgi:hypothetical protein